MEALPINTVFIDGLELSKQAGNVKSVNIVMLGALTAALNMDFDTMNQAIVDCVPEKFRQVNLDALKLGYQAYKEA